MPASSDLGLGNHQPGRPRFTNLPTERTMPFPRFPLLVPSACLLLAPGLPNSSLKPFMSMEVSVMQEILQGTR